MTTITGTIETAADVPLHVLITFTPTSAPFIQSGGAVIANKTVQLFSNQNDGSWSQALEPGAYTVNFASTPAFNIAIVVPSTGGPYTIDQLANLPPPSPVYTPSGSGSPQGVVTAPPGSTYIDTTGGGFWGKMTGTGNTGWQQLLQL